MLLAASLPQELEDSVRLLQERAADEAAAAAADRRRMEGVAKSLEARLAQVGWTVGRPACFAWTAFGQP